MDNMPPGETSAMNIQPVSGLAKVFAGRWGRRVRENLTAYLFLFPALSLIFIFGLFPVAFSLYVSLYKWRIKQDKFLGLGNYVKAMDELAYVLAFGLAIGAIWLTYWFLRRTWQMARENREISLVPLTLVPGLLMGLATLQFIRFFSLALPEILSIGEKVQRIERTREIFIQFFREAFQVEAVAAARELWLWLLGASLVAWFVVNVFVPSIRKGIYIYYLFAATVFGLIAYQLGDFTLTSIQEAYAQALEAGDEIAIWTHIILITSGGLLLLFSWKLWYQASQSESNRSLLFKILASLMLLCGAWTLIAEVPPLIEAGDEDMWGGLAITAWFSFGTVPLQLVLGLGIALLLYQNIKAKSFFRMIYFLPYITPAVAAAAVFRVIFSNRPTGMMNQIWVGLGWEPLNWLLEPKSVFSFFGFEGPSLALVVIILFSVWNYSGYNAVIFLAGLGSISRSLYEAASIDGANAWQVFRYITLPLLSPITYFLSLLGVIGTFKAFNSVYVLRNPAALRSVDTMSLVIWDELKIDNRYGYAATLAFVLFGVVLILTLINNQVQGKRVFYG